MAKGEGEREEGEAKEKKIRLKYQVARALYIPPNDWLWQKNIVAFFLCLRLLPSEFITFEEAFAGAKRRVPTADCRTHLRAPLIKKQKQDTNHHFKGFAQCLYPQSPLDDGPSPSAVLRHRVIVSSCIPYQLHISNFPIRYIIQR